MMKVLVLCSLVVAATAHLCLVSPPQRGSMLGLDKAGSPDCVLLKAPCGGRDLVHNPSIALRAGENFTVSFQKNLDHFNKTSPGYFSISVGFDELVWTELARIPDKGQPSLTLYAVNVTMPQLKGHPHHTLQVTYVTKNPQAPPIFYQCSDFMLMG